MKTRRVVVTGMGALTPLGNSVEESWRNACDGVCGIGPITQYDCSSQKVSLAGEVKGFDPTQIMDKKEVRRTDRFTQLALAAAQEAVKQSGLDFAQEDAARCGVILSSGIGGLLTMQNTCETGVRKGYDKVSPFFIPMTITNLAAAQVAIRFDIHGMCTCPVAACAGGGAAVGDAMRFIRDGYGEVVLCGGAEATITPLGMGGFTSMHALSTESNPERASIPFDAERSGFVMGEGAGVLVLEEYEHAKRRGATILGEVCGYGATCDGYHITAPDPQGTWAARAMTQAMEDAGITPQQVGYINAHGTSTPMNDACETMAVKQALGEWAKQVPMSSTKSMTGHLLGASGAVEAIFCLMALRDQFAPPTIHYQVPDPQCDLDVVPNVGRKIQVDYALSNSLGFGGHNTSLVFGRGEGM